MAHARSKAFQLFEPSTRPPARLRGPSAGWPRRSARRAPSSSHPLRDRTAVRSRRGPPPRARSALPWDAARAARRAGCSLGEPRWMNVVTRGLRGLAACIHVLGASIRALVGWIGWVAAFAAPPVLRAALGELSPSLGRPRRRDHGPRTGRAVARLADRTNVRAQPAL